MATLIVMPRLSPTMEEGVLIKWNKNEGDKISPGDIIAEVETDKANMDFPLEDEGVMLKLLVNAGDTVKLGAPVAILGEAGEDISALLEEAKQGAAPAKEPEQAEEKKQQPAKQAKEKQPKEEQAEEEEADEEEPVPEQTDENETEEKEPAEKQAPPEKPAPQKAAQPPSPGGRIVASPLARRLADDAGLDIRSLSGSGPGGRIVKRDIEAAMAGTGRPAPLGAAPAAAPQGEELVPMSMMRKTIARRLTEAKQTVPHFYLTAEATVDDLWHLREQIDETLEDFKISINDLVIKATARALRMVPAANMSFSAEGAVRHHRVDVGVAVAIEDGLITPVVRDADRKSVGAISQEIRDLAARAKIKKLQPQEYQGATFTVSNLGMYGIREFFAIINPPESGILAVGKVEKRPVVVEEDGADSIIVKRRMTLTLSCDHRIVDGAVGSQLMAQIIKGLEQPLLLAL